MKRVREEVLYKYPFFQPVDGYRYSVDSLLLAGFIQSKEEKIKVLDIGTGSGIITMLLSKRFPHWDFSAIEIQKALYEIALDNFDIHKLKVELLEGDYRDIKGQDIYDLIVSNPPFFNDGHLSKNRSEAIARHEVLGDMESLIFKVQKLLKSGGYFYVIYPAERMAELLTKLNNNKLEPYSLKLIFPKFGKIASSVMVTAKKGYKGRLKVLTPLYLEGSSEEDSTELKLLYEKGVLEW